MESEEEESERIAQLKKELKAAVKAADDRKALCRFWKLDATVWPRYIRAMEGDVRKATEMILKTARWRRKLEVDTKLSCEVLDFHFQQRKNYLHPKRDKGSFISLPRREFVFQ